MCLMSMRRRKRDERGAVAILMAGFIVGLLVVVAMVLDFGLVRMDRQQLKSLSDSAVMTGIASGDGGTGEIYPYRAVCGAVRSLQAAPPFKPEGAYAGLPDSLCTTLPINAGVKCLPSGPVPVIYDETVTRQGVTYRVRIQSPVTLTSGGWTQESMNSLKDDQSTVGGCDQLAVEIWETRKPGLGSLATTSDLQFAMRSAARATVGGNESLAPALLLLERTGCEVLKANSTGAPIYVYGLGGTPGSIHADSLGTGGCGPNNKQVFQAKPDQIVALGSTSPLGVPGLITSSATVPADTLTTGIDTVYGTTAAAPASPPPDKFPVTYKAPITRAPVDERYRQNVRNHIAGVQSTWGNPGPPDSSWKVVGCNPTIAQRAEPKLWVDCPDNTAFTPGGDLLGTHIYFQNALKQGVQVSMPNARHVFLADKKVNDALSMGGGDRFCVRSVVCSLPVLPATKCATTATPTLDSRATVYVRRGAISMTGGLLKMCNTTVIMLGDDVSFGCVPNSNGVAPTSTPCPPSTAGGGNINLTGGDIDWTAPNRYSGLIPVPDQPDAYKNLEDLALWSESAGTFSFRGGGGMNTVGVYMVPNADYASVGGSSGQNLTNAQYVARRFEVFGNAALRLTTDPKNAVTVPSITGYVLIR